MKQLPLERLAMHGSDHLSMGNFIRRYATYYDFLPASQISS